METIATVDCASRTAMAGLVRDYLRGTLPPEDLLARLHDLAEHAEDPLVREIPVMIDLWDCELGDVTDLAKRDWDFFQRLLLLLQTDAQLLPDEEGRVNARVAAALMFCVVVLLGIAGIATVAYLWVMYPMAGAVSYALSAAMLVLMMRDGGNTSASKFPFSSITQIKSAILITSFRKTRYPLTPRLTKPLHRMLSLLEGGLSSAPYIIGAPALLYIAGPAFLVKQLRPAEPPSADYRLSNL